MSVKSYNSGLEEELRAPKNLSLKGKIVWYQNKYREAILNNSFSEAKKENYKKYGHEIEGYSSGDVEDMCEQNNLYILKSKGYSCSLSEIFSNINWKTVDNKLLLGILFYPLYFLSIISDFILKDYNGLFFVIKKN